MAKQFLTSDSKSLRIQCDGLIRQSEFDKARAIVKSLSPNKIPPSEAVSWAELARRCQMSRFSLKILHRIIYPVLKTERRPQADETIEYAIALERIGAYSESRRLLTNLSDKTNDPKKYFALGFLAMANWDYQESLVHWTEYLKASSLTDYQRITGLINQLACMIQLEMASAAPLIAELSEKLSTSSHVLMLGNLRLLSAQFLFIRGDLEQAKTQLDEAARVIAKGDNLSLLFVQKWRAIIDAHLEKDVEILFRFRKEALKLRHWETLRHLDYQAGLIQPKQAYAHWVYFGTPYPSFRRKMEKQWTFPDETWLGLGAAKSQRWDPWYLDDLELDGNIAHRCVALLMTDRYRPLREGEIFSRLYPDECFQPHSTPARIRQIIFRARAWVENINPKLRIDEIEGAYALRLTSNIEFRVRKKMISYDPMGFLFDRFRERLPTPFSKSDFCRMTGRSPTTAQTILSTAEEQKLISRLGKGRGTRFRFTP